MGRYLNFQWRWRWIYISFKEAIVPVVEVFGDVLLKGPSLEKKAEGLEGLGPSLLQPQAAARSLVPFLVGQRTLTLYIPDIISKGIFTDFSFETDTSAFGRTHVGCSRCLGVAVEGESMPNYTRTESIIRHEDEDTYYLSKK